MKLNDEDLFKPLSAKVGRKQYSSGGIEKDQARIRMGEARRIASAFERRKRDAERRAKGGLT